MATLGNKAHGVKLYLAGTAATSTAFATASGTAVEECTIITPPEESNETADATSHDSAADEFVNVGVIDGGEVAIEGIWSGATGQEQLRGYNGGVNKMFFINLPTTNAPNQITFSGAVTGWQITAERPDILKYSSKIKVSGAVVHGTQP